MPVNLSEQNWLSNNKKQVEYDGYFTNAPGQEHAHDPGHAGDGRGAQVCFAGKRNADGHGKDARKEHQAARKKILFVHMRYFLYEKMKIKNATVLAAKPVAQKRY